MKNFLKRFIVLGLVLSLAIPSSLAISISSRSVMENRLISLGIPQDLLDYLDSTALSKLYNDSFVYEIEYAGSSTANSGDTIVPYGAISSSDMTFTISALRYYKPDNKNLYQKFVFYVRYNWAKNKPSDCFGDDGICINWDSSVLTFNGDFYAKHEYSTNGGSTWNQYDYVTDPQDNLAGLGHVFTISRKGNMLRGVLEFELIPAMPLAASGSSDNEYSTGVNAKYAHQTMHDGSLTIGFFGSGVTLEGNTLDTKTATFVLEYYKD